MGRRQLNADLYWQGRSDVHGARGRQRGNFGHLICLMAWSFTLSSRKDFKYKLCQNMNNKYGRTRMNVFGNQINKDVVYWTYFWWRG